MAFRTGEVEKIGFKISTISLLPSPLYVVMIPDTPVHKDEGDGVEGFGNDGPPRLQPREGSCRSLELTALRALLYSSHAKQH